MDEMERAAASGRDLAGDGTGGIDRAGRAGGDGGKRGPEDASGSGGGGGTGAGNGAGGPAIATMLASRAARGDTAAFEALYRQHAGLVYATCLRLCANRARAEELTQDAFVRAWQALGSFRGGSFASWIRRIALNTALDERRARAGREAARLDDDEVSAPAGRPGERLDLERAIAALPSGARSVFVLFEIEGLAHREIADLLGVAETTSKTQLHRARSLLREALGR